MQYNNKDLNLILQIQNKRNLFFNNNKIGVALKQVHSTKKKDFIIVTWYWRVPLETLTGWMTRSGRGMIELTDQKLVESLHCHFKMIWKSVKMMINVLYIVTLKWSEKV